MALIDGSVLTVALPKLRAALDADLASVQWVINSYLLALAALTLIGGALADAYGKARMLSIGCLLFGAASGGCALAPSLGWLIGARVLQGIAAALLTPASLALIGATYPKNERTGALNMRQNSPIRPFFPSSLFQQIRALISRNRIANQLLEIITLGLEAAVRSPSQSVAGENPTLREHSMGKAGSARSEGRATLWLLMATALLFALGFTFGRALPSWPSGDPNWSSQLEANRGRFATTPSEISTRGWKDILLRVYENIFEHRVMAIAAGVTFYALLAIFPAIAALFSIFGLFADPATISRQLDVIADFVPSGAVDIMREELSRLTTQGKAVLGVGFVVGLTISLWSANSGINALFDALNIVYSEKEKRSFIKLYALTLGFTTGAIAFLLIALAAVVG